MTTIMSVINFVPDRTTLDSKLMLYLVGKPEGFFLMQIFNSTDIKITEGKMTINEYRKLACEIVLKLLKGTVKVFKNDKGYTIGNKHSYITLSNVNLFEREEWLNSKNQIIYKDNGSLTIV